MQKSIRKFFILSTLPTLAIPSTAQAEKTSIEGRCEYAPRYAELLETGDHDFAICDSVAIETDGSIANIDFRREYSGSWFAFRGQIDNGNVIVNELAVRGREPVPVRGQCELTSRDGEIRVVTCLAQRGGTTYVANFERH